MSSASFRETEKPLLLPLMTGAVLFSRWVHVRVHSCDWLTAIQLQQSNQITMEKRYCVSCVALQKESARTFLGCVTQQLDRDSGWQKGGSEGL